MPRTLQHSRTRDHILTGIEEVEEWQPLKFSLVLPGAFLQQGKPLSLLGSLLVCVLTV